MLQGRRDWPGNELAGRLDVSGRTIYPGFIDAYGELSTEVGPSTAPSDDASGGGGFRKGGEVESAICADF